MSVPPSDFSGTQRSVLAPSLKVGAWFAGGMYELPPPLLLLPGVLLLVSPLLPPPLFPGAGVVSSMVSVAVEGDAVPTAGGSEPKDRLTVSSLRSESSVVEMVNVWDVSVSAKASSPLVRPETE